ncbi:hypothetical protein CABS01_14345 [Colletotrichum abscissum]|uniref:Uncharacterized protein n=1 Tax=Colletotrichum costaricense TaxID=1209916 RepID=A0AAI9YF47_9PEZI|nr:uncharacterized protein CCOS01_16721 [Colletotrichum costaricense]XP_060393392.1 uncharacterized protein CABS01_14345 [Colletotrichum abscissum]KAK1480819.1 hypothetical protein CABS01_14345 [Colletotrichum abscissum]KAK1505147.1 hypothetical protein CCOS01_16721 [Colletotrichum costaricense]
MQVLGSHCSCRIANLEKRNADSYFGLACLRGSPPPPLPENYQHVAEDAQGRRRFPYSRYQPLLPQASTMGSPPVFRSSHSATRWFARSPNLDKLTMGEPQAYSFFGRDPKEERQLTLNAVDFQLVVTGVPLLHNKGDAMH